MPGIVIPFSDNDEFVSNYIFPVVLKDSDKSRRDKVREFLHAEGIQTSVHYPSIHRFSIYSDSSVSLPNTEYVSDNEVTLPMYASLTAGEVDFICDTLIKALERYGH